VFGFGAEVAGDAIWGGDGEASEQGRDDRDGVVDGFGLQRSAGVEAFEQDRAVFGVAVEQQCGTAALPGGEGDRLVVGFGSEIAGRARPEPRVPPWPSVERRNPGRLSPIEHLSSVYGISGSVTARRG
jgi:hypothetical protein